MSTYTWRNRLLLDLPFRMAQHDPVNTQSLNVGRAGAALNAAFGAGAAQPTKLGHRRGYDFDDGDYMECSASYSLGASRISVLMFLTGPPIGITDCAFSWETVGGNRVAYFLTSATEMRFFCGGAAAANAAIAIIANYAMGPGQPYTVCGAYDGTDTLLYINGELAGTAATPSSPSPLPEPMWIGARTNSANYWTGEMYHVGMADFALSPTQVAQYHREMMKRLHQI